MHLVSLHDFGLVPIQEKKAVRNESTAPLIHNLDISWRTFILVMTAYNEYQVNFRSLQSHRRKLRDLSETSLYLFVKQNIFKHTKV